VIIPQLYIDPKDAKDFDDVLLYHLKLENLEISVLESYYDVLALFRRGSISMTKRIKELSICIYLVDMSNVAGSIV
jgi:hypothetical protein